VAYSRRAGNDLGPAPPRSAGQGVRIERSGGGHADRRDRAIPASRQHSISWVLLTNLPVKDFESAAENEGSLFAATDVDNALIGLSAQGLSDDGVGLRDRPM
jgi:hypothetical protein